jgi:hypothetical protein
LATAAHRPGTACRRHRPRHRLGGTVARPRRRPAAHCLARPAPFLDGWSPHNIDILDIPGPLPEVDELVLAINTRDATTCLLPRSPGSGVYYFGHDDCYLYAETIDPALPTRLLTRLLTLFAGSALLDDDTDTLTVPHPEQRLAATLLHRGSHWVGTILNSQPGRTVTLALTPTTKAWRLADPVSVEPSHRITLDLQAGTWRVIPAMDDQQALDWNQD